MRGLDFWLRYPIRSQASQDLPLAELLVEDTVHFAPLDKLRNRIWHSLAPRGYGYNRQGPEHNLFMVTMYHETHCLWVFANALVGATDAHHLHHCAGYIRGGTLCSSDLTLEKGHWEQRDFEDVTRRGTGTRHVCRDWTVIWDELESNWESWNTTKYELFDRMNHHWDDTPLSTVVPE